MRREDIKSKQAQGVLFDTHIIANPANTREWIVLLKKGAGTSFFLVDDQEQVESFADLNRCRCSALYSAESANCSACSTRPTRISAVRRKPLARTCSSMVARVPLTQS